MAFAAAIQQQETLQQVGMHFFFNEFLDPSHVKFPFIVRLQGVQVDVVKMGRRCDVGNGGFPIEPVGGFVQHREQLPAEGALVAFLGIHLCHFCQHLAAEKGRRLYGMCCAEGHEGAFRMPQVGIVGWLFV